MTEVLTEFISDENRSKPVLNSNDIGFSQRLLNNVNTPSVYFLTGIFFQQLGHNVQVTLIQVLITALCTGTQYASMGSILIAVITSLDVVGAFVGSGFSRRKVSPWRVQVSGMVCRTILLGAAAIVWASGVELLFVMVALFTLDFLCVGVLDTCRSVMPLYLEMDQTKRRKLNSASETVFQFGNLCGPLVAGGVIAACNSNLLIPLFLAPMSFVISVVAFALVRLDLVHNVDREIKVDKRSAAA
jgi:hypothetical protein